MLGSLVSSIGIQSIYAQAWYIHLTNKEKEMLQMLQKRRSLNSFVQLVELVAMNMQGAETESLRNVNGRVPRDKGMGGSLEVLPLVQSDSESEGRFFFTKANQGTTMIYHSFSLEQKKKKPKGHFQCQDDKKQFSSKRNYNFPTRDTLAYI